ncbi:hypothetical protein J6590_101579 [Homalodisca vitripennis]|nr:hypothetical protein J6590_101579 [Homalodisca vitripennis]
MIDIPIKSEIYADDITHVDAGRDLVQLSYIIMGKGPEIGSGVLLGHRLSNQLVVSNDMATPPQISSGYIGEGYSRKSLCVTAHS